MALSLLALTISGAALAVEGSSLRPGKRSLSRTASKIALLEDGPLSALALGVKQERWEKNSH